MVQQSHPRRGNARRWALRDHRRQSCEVDPQAFAGQLWDHKRRQWNCYWVAAFPTTSSYWSRTAAP